MAILKVQDGNVLTEIEIEDNFAQFIYDNYSQKYLEEKHEKGETLEFLRSIHRKTIDNIIQLKGNSVVHSFEQLIYKKEQKLTIDNIKELVDYFNTFFLEFLELQVTKIGNDNSGPITIYLNQELIKEININNPSENFGPAYPVAEEKLYRLLKNEYENLKKLGKFNKNDLILLEKDQENSFSKEEWQHIGKKISEANKKKQQIKIEGEEISIDISDNLADLFRDVCGTSYTFERGATELGNDISGVLAHSLLCNDKAKDLLCKLNMQEEITAEYLQDTIKSLDEIVITEKEQEALGAAAAAPSTIHDQKPVIKIEVLERTQEVQISKKFAKVVQQILGDNFLQDEHTIENFRQALTTLYSDRYFKGKLKPKHRETLTEKSLNEREFKNLKEELQHLDQFCRANEQNIVTTSDTNPKSKIKLSRSSSIKRFIKKIFKSPEQEDKETKSGVRTKVFHQNPARDGKNRDVAKKIEGHNEEGETVVYDVEERINPDKKDSHKITGR